ncbi:MAG: hypothetical protein ACLSC9_03090 [Barnesiella sp.]
MQYMILGQLTAGDSIRDLRLSLEVYKNNFYNLGLSSTVTRTNLGEVNRNRDYRIYEGLAYNFIAKVRISYYKNYLDVKADANVYAFDFSTIDFCLNVFLREEFRKHKEGIELHTLYE